MELKKLSPKSGTEPAVDQADAPMNDKLKKRMQRK
jgi:hypothetical protein